MMEAVVRDLAPGNREAAGLLVTPDDRGALPSGESGAVLPAATWVESALPERLDTIGDIYGDSARTLEIAREIVSVGRTLGDAVNEIAGPSAGDAYAPLSYNIVYQILAVAADRAMRLAAAGFDPGSTRLMPERIDYGAVAAGSGDDLRTLHKTQLFQWLILRVLAGAPDAFDVATGTLPRWLRVRAGRWRQDRMAVARGRDGLHGTHLRHVRKSLDEAGLAYRQVPNLVLANARRRDGRRRRKIVDATASCSASLWPLCGLGGDAGYRLGRLLGTLFPESRLECRDRNLDAYRSYFDRWNVSGLVTATGHAWNDAAAFFWVHCNLRNLSTVIVQHGGQYAYDDKQPQFFALDQTLPSHFVSWGWTDHYSAYADLGRRARIVPLPDPRLSGMRDGYDQSKRPDERVLLVPLSKFRTLEVRFGSIACDGRLNRLRETTADVISRVAGAFDRIIITHRGEDFARDPLANRVAALDPKRVEVHHARDMPASRLMPRASAVFWDVTATGPFESLTYGIPTVVLMREGRWARDAKWAEEALVTAGIGAYSAEQAAANLTRFARDTDAWATARKLAMPVLDAYARSSDGWKGEWNEFFSEVFDSPGIGNG